MFEDSTTDSAREQTQATDGGAPAPETAAPEPAPSLRDQLRASLAADAAANGEAGETTEAKPSATPSAPAAEAPAKPAARERDPATGKFVSQAQEGDAAPKAAATAADQKEATAATPAPTVVPVAPASMTADERTAFEKLPDDMKQFVARREAERERHFRSRTAAIAGEAERVTQIDKLLAPHRQKWALHGVSDVQALTHFLAVSEMLDRDPVGGLRWLAQQRGVDMSKLAADPAAEEYVDPTYAKLYREVETLRATVQQSQEAARRASESQQNATVGSLAQKIEAFSSQTDAAGKPLHPYFHDVFDHVMSLVPSLRQRTPAADPLAVLQEAYDMAVWADPRTRARLQAAQQAAHEEQRRRQAAEDAAKARRTAVQVTGAPGTSPAAQMPASLRDQLRQAMAGRLA